MEEQSQIRSGSVRWGATRPNAIPVQHSFVTGAGVAAISDQEFHEIKDWIYRTAGINLSSQKKAMVMGRLASRLRYYRLSSYGEYFGLLQSSAHPAELQIAVDLLTTNETQFFREPRHFSYLSEKLLPRHPAGRMLRVWSAASSSGEEPYSIAMTLATVLGEAPWEILASDLSSRVLERARTGHYSMARAKTIPRSHLLAHCLKGIGSQEGTFLIEPRLRARMQFMQINLVERLPQIGQFEVIFLRNVMIYFDTQTKHEVIARLVRHLRPGGHLIVGHAESLNGVSEMLKPVAPSIYYRQ
jgi:chemotaxis protein methyltransferase CheR